MKDQILHTSGTEPAYIGMNIRRPRIERMLLDAVKKPITTIVANVGCGKTQAVSTLYETSDSSIIWFQLTEFDNLPSRFWERVCYAMGPGHEELAMNLRELGFPYTITAFHRLLELVAQELASFGLRSIVVFDDFFMLHDKQLLQAVERLVYANLKGLSIVIVSNTQPQINIAAFYEKGMLSRITENDLMLTKEEVQSYYKVQGITIDEPLLTEVCRQTGGWFFAVYLVGLSLSKGSYHQDDAFSEETLDIFALIESDIYQPMIPELRGFLLKLAVLGDIPLRLMRELAGSNKELIPTLFWQYSILLRFDPSTDCYCMLGLLREFLLARHNTFDPEEVAALNEVAAKWFDTNGKKIEAIKYYRAYENYQRIFEIILEHSYRCPKEIADLFLTLIEQAPSEVVEANPVLLVVRVRLLLNNFRIAEAHEAMRNIYHTYRVMPESPRQQMVLGEAYMMMGIMSLMAKTLDFETYFQKADALLPNGSAIVDNKLALVIGASFFPLKDVGPGSLQKMRDTLFRAMPYAVRVMKGCGAGLEYLAASEHDYAIGDIQNAEKNAYTALYAAQQQEQYDIEYMAYATLLGIWVSRGDYMRAAVVLQTAQKYMSRIQSTDCVSLCDIVVSEFYAHIERPEKVSKWILTENSEEEMSFAPISLSRGQMVREWCYLVQERYFELLGYLKQLDEQYRLRNSLLGLIQNAVMRAVAYYYAGDREQALLALEESYQLSYENEIIMYHVEHGKRMRTLIRAARQADCAIPNEWLDTIYTKASTYAKRLALVASMYDASIGTAEKQNIQLTKRERELLVGLCQGLTREQIAESCDLSINTVKRILPNLYSKLGAVNGMDAVRIATALQLIG